MVLGDPLLQLVARCTLALIFLGSGLSKLVHRERFRGVLRDYRLLPPAVSDGVAYALPPLELLTAGCLLWGPWVQAGAAGALLLIALFSGAVAWNLLRGRTHVDCGCFMGVLSQEINPWLLVRNGLFAGMAAVLVFGAPRARPLNSYDILSALGASLAIAGLYAAFQLVFRSPRSTGGARILRRKESSP